MKKLWSFGKRGASSSYVPAPSGPVESETFLTSEPADPATVVIDGTAINIARFPDSATKLTRIAAIQRLQPEGEIVNTTYTGTRLRGVRSYLGIRDPHPYGQEDSLLLPLRPAVPGELQRFYPRGAEEQQLWHAIASDMNLKIYKKAIKKGATQHLNNMTASPSDTSPLIIDGKPVIPPQQHAPGLTCKLEELAKHQQKRSKATDAVPHQDLVEYAAGVNRLLGFRKGEAPDAQEDAMIVDYRPHPGHPHKVILRGEDEKDCIRSIQANFVRKEIINILEKDQRSERRHTDRHRPRQSLAAVPEGSEAESSSQPSYTTREQHRRDAGGAGRSAGM